MSRDLIRAIAYGKKCTFIFHLTLSIPFEELSINEVLKKQILEFTISNNYCIIKETLFKKRAKWRDILMKMMTELLLK